MSSLAQAIRSGDPGRQAGRDGPAARAQGPGARDRAAQQQAAAAGPPPAASRARRPVLAERAPGHCRPGQAGGRARWLAIVRRASCSTTAVSRCVRARTRRAASSFSAFDTDGGEGTQDERIARLRQLLDKGILDRVGVRGAATSRSCRRAPSARDAQGSGAHLEPVQQVSGRLGHRVDSGLEGVGVVRRRGTEAADLAYVLQGGCPHVLGRHLLGVGLTQGLDASAHEPNLARPGGHAARGGWLAQQARPWHHGEIMLLTDLVPESADPDALYAAFSRGRRARA